MTPVGGLEKRVGPSRWLTAPATQAVFEMLERGGFTGRAVGGVVRNALLGLPVADVDIATDARPEDVVRLAEAAGLKAIPTGIAHGTVTVVSSGQPFEVTTLRIDVATDGRHAEVAFTSDWAADAARRDFTVNALYCDRDGRVFDPLGGLADLDPLRIRFIGNPAERIAEDYLRVLRFFRFTAMLSGNGDLDREGLAACVEAAPGLARISGERIRAELWKLLVARRAVRVVAAMIDSGVFEAAVGVVPDHARFERLVLIENAVTAAPDTLPDTPADMVADPVLRLAALAVRLPEDAARLDRRLKLSSRERERLEAAAAFDTSISSQTSEREARSALYRLGADAYRDAVLLSWAASAAGLSDPGYIKLESLPRRWEAPRFPLGGADVVALGVLPGPRVGAVLSTVEEQWIASDFALSRDELVACARRAAGP